MHTQHKQDYPINFGDIKTLLIEEAGVSVKTTITPDTRLAEDLKIDGDDGIELIEKFAQKYHVDLTDFHPYHYFHAEGMHFLTIPVALLRLLLWPWRDRVIRPAEAHKPVTLKMLMDAARRRKWIEE